MEAVWRSYMSKHNQVPPENAFKLVNYSRAHPKLRELSYNQAKLLLQKHSPLRGASDSQYGGFKIRKIGRRVRPSQSVQNDDDASSKSSDDSQHSRCSSNSTKSGKSEAMTPNPSGRSSRGQAQNDSPIPDFSPTQRQRPKKRTSKKDAETPHPSSVPADSPSAFGFPPRNAPSRRGGSLKNVQSFERSMTEYSVKSPRRRKKIPVRGRRKPHRDNDSPLHLTKSHSDDVEHHGSPSPRSPHNKMPSYQHRPQHRNRKTSLSDPEHLISDYAQKHKLRDHGRRKRRDRGDKFRSDNDLYPQGHEVVYQSKYSQTVSRRQDLSLRMIKDGNEQSQSKKRRRGDRLRTSTGNILSSSKSVSEATSSAGSINVGDYVLLNKGREAIILYIGAVHFADGIWFGVELIDGSVGIHDGAINGKRYFKTPPGRGLFVQGHKIRSKLANRHYARRRHSIHSDNSSDRNTSSSFVKSRSVNAPNTSGRRRKRDKSPSRSPRDKSPRRRLQGSRSKPTRSSQKRRRDHHARSHNVRPQSMGQSFYDQDGIIVDDGMDEMDHFPLNSTPALEISASPLVVASPISVHDINAPKYVSSGSSSNGHSPPTSQRHLVARSVNDQEFIDINALKDMLRSEIENEFQSKFDELKAILLEKEQQQKIRRRKKKRRKKKKRRRKSRSRTSTVQRSKSVTSTPIKDDDIDGVLPSQRNMASNPRWNISNSQQSRGNDTRDSSGSENDLDSPMSDYAMAIRPNDLHLDHIDAASNISDEYAKSGDLQPASNGSPSKESNDAADRYLDDNEVDTFNSSHIAKEEVVMDDEMMTYEM